MPQMSPIWWTTLFSMFILMYMMYMIYMYFIVMYNMKTFIETQKKSSKNMNWLW